MKICNMVYQEYTEVRESGEFWELYPEASGEFYADKQLSREGRFEIENDM